MPRYLCIAAYASEGATGVLGKGGTARRTAIESRSQTSADVLDTFDFPFGEDDVCTVSYAARGTT